MENSICIKPEGSLEDKSDHMTEGHEQENTLQRYKPQNIIHIGSEFSRG